ncbi:MAG: acyl-CoA dehydrogenase family protein [Sedimentisphaerales bacterium]|jgi:alkylation response protein AidB-like acyl-CoA dehydrogenase|nr:acyl-CoA dehydrogenase family protein [Sedimentisphaerales bacterium]
MANFFTDNDDLRFLFDHLDLKGIATLNEEGFRFAKEFDYAPQDPQEAVENYRMVLTWLGQLCGDFIAPRAESVDREGNRLNPDGTVTRPKGIVEDLEQLAKADLMGFTLPYRFGGLNFPNTIYSMAIEILSRADAPLMNLFGLQGIAETINAFADESIKQQYLPAFAAGKVTGAMALTEPDAGSDLQAVKLRAFQDAQGNWYLNGVKRFITNGCGEVLLVLARSEPDRSGGLGLSLFVCERGPTVHIRRLEEKLGIHGSPTCEIFFDNTPCQLIGQRQRGLVTYVMSLMNGARIGIAAQSLGIAEAAYRVARNYAATRRQFGVSIEMLPAVRDMLMEDRIAIEAGRALLYLTSQIVDQAVGMDRQISNAGEAQLPKELKDRFRLVRRYAELLTPMSKYYCSEMANRVAYDAIQVLGGSGYMRDYPAERIARDARITTIYEGTTQLQIVAAVRGVCNGTAERLLGELASGSYDPSMAELLRILEDGTKDLNKAVAFVKDSGNDYMDLYGRPLVDMAIELIQGHLFCQQASSQVQMQVEDAKGQTIDMRQRKATIARRFVKRNAYRHKGLLDLICSGDRSTFQHYNAVVNPVSRE